jgi:hypothetical protein
VAPEVIGLGEDFSIVTEYTSFLVLENDAEYARWKIARKNLEATSRDRGAQAQRRAQLDAIRNKALADIGPQASSSSAPPPPAQMASARQRPNQPATTVPSAAPLHGRNQSSDIQVPSSGGGGGGGGSGPIGPLGVLAAAWLMRRKRKVS